MIFRKSPAELEKMRVSSRIIGELLDELAGMIAPGVSTWDLDAFAYEFIVARAPGLPSKATPFQA